ncbi:MAG TPA: hypothetical protein VEQ40_03775, partial [Pyrinomonadaceae bacterium]|nr:hypothetical protein [Pyrinomonadaceae bacterium]
RLRTFLWIAGLAILVIVLLYFEQTAILYLLATLGLTTLLIIVARADLSGARKLTSETDLGDDAAAIADGITAGAAPAASRAARDGRTTGKRR